MADLLHPVCVNTFKYREEFQIKDRQATHVLFSIVEGGRVGFSWAFPVVRPRLEAPEFRYPVSGFPIHKCSSSGPRTDNSKVSPFTEGCRTVRPPGRWAPQPDPINSRHHSQHSQGQGLAAIFPSISGTALSLPWLREGSAAPWSDKRPAISCCGPTLADKGRPLCQREENITVP